MNQILSFIKNNATHIVYLSIISILLALSIFGVIFYETRHRLTLEKVELIIDKVEEQSQQDTVLYDSKVRNNEEIQSKFREAKLLDQELRSKQTNGYEKDNVIKFNKIMESLYEQYPEISRIAKYRFRAYDHYITFLHERDNEQKAKEVYEEAKKRVKERYEYFKDNVPGIPRRVQGLGTRYFDEEIEALPDNLEALEELEPEDIDMEEVMDEFFKS